jgi:hypothetical protein
MTAPEIASLITDDAPELVRVWVQAVRADERIQSDADLSEGGLVDHVPVMINEIADLLRSGRSPSVENVREARVHAYTRYQQGYRVRDLVRETSHLRLLLLDHVRENLSGGAGAEARLAAYHEAARSINLYLDEELRYAVSIYTEEMKTA